MKKETYRDRVLLDLARGQPCLMSIPNVCNRDPATVVAAHSNQQQHGKGRGIKAHDAYSVWTCARCHTWLDQSFDADRETKTLAFAAGMVRQIVAWTEIASSPTSKPRNKNAARDALIWIANHKRGKNVE